MLTILSNKLWFYNTFVSLRFIDFGTTYWNITKYHAVETYTPAKWILNHGSYYLLFGFVLAASGMMLISLQMINKPIWKKVAIGAWILNLISLYGPINNLVIIIQKVF